MWRVRNSNPARRENHLHNRYVLPDAKAGAGQKQAVTEHLRAAASDVDRRKKKMETDGELVVAPDLKFGPIYPSAPAPSRPKTPADEYYETTRAPPTPRRLKDESSNKNLELTPIWQQIISYKKLPYNVNKSALFHEISQRLVDPEWQVRQHGLKVLQDVIPIVKPDELDDFMMNCVLPEVVLNLSHSAPAVKSSAFDALLIYIKHSQDPEYVLRVVVFQTLETGNVPSNLQICAMNCLPTLLAQVLAHEKFNEDGDLQNQTIPFSDYSLSVDSSSGVMRRASSRNNISGVRTPDRARTPMSTSSQVSHQSLLHLIVVLGKKMAQITFQHCAVACLEKIKHLVGANFFDRLFEGHKPNLKRDFDALCQVYEVPNLNISDVMISPMDSLVSSDGKDADGGFLTDDDNDRLSSTSSFSVSSSDENPRAQNQNRNQNRSETRPDSRSDRDRKKVQDLDYERTLSRDNPPADKTLLKKTQNEAAISAEDSGTSHSNGESTIRESRVEKSGNQAQSMSETDCINNGKVLVETEIKLSEDTAIQMMVLQGKDEQKPEDKDYEEDEEIKQLKRVTFGGELIKLRTPDSDHQNTDDDSKRRDYDSIQIYHRDDRGNGKFFNEPTPRPETGGGEIIDVTDRFVKLDMDEISNSSKRTSENHKSVKVLSPAEETRDVDLPDNKVVVFDEVQNDGVENLPVLNKPRDLNQTNQTNQVQERRNIGTPEPKTEKSSDTGRLIAGNRNTLTPPREGLTRRPDSGGGARGKLTRKIEQRPMKRSRRPRSSHIPIPIKPALHRPKYRRYIFSANNRRSSSKSQASSSGATYDVRDSPIPNLEGGESLTSSSESEPRYRYSGQSVGSNDSLPRISLIPANVLTDLNNKDDWRQRVRGLDQLTHSLRQPDVVRFLGVNDSQKTGSAMLLKLLIGILNERKTPLRVLNSCLKALRSLCLALPVQNLVSQLPHLVPATCQYLGGVINISVKLEAVETIKMLLRKLRPSSVVNTLFTEQCFFSKSSKMRESSLLCLLYALMIFPSTEFNIPGLINVLMKFGCSEPKRRVRQALLDTYAVLGQFAPFPVSSIHETDGKDVKLFKKAVQVRLTRRQLPTVTPEGLISYALQVNSSSKGADVEWVQAGSGTVSAGSAESQSQIAMAPFLLSDQQQPLSGGVWGESINEIMITGIPPVSLHTRDAPTHNYYSDEFKVMQDGSYNDDYRYTYQTYEFPQIKTTRNTSGKTSEIFGKNSGAPSRGIKTWPPVHNNSKLPTSPSRAVSVDLPSHQLAQQYDYRDFSSNSSNSNFPAIVNSRSPDWKVPSWAENTYYPNYPKVSNMSKWSRQEYFLNAEQYLRIEPLGDAVQTGRAALSENQSGVNKFSNSTSVHGRMTHAASGHQNEFAPLSSRIVNLPEDEVDFATNSKAVKSPLKIVSNAKSYENLTQKNGYGDKIKYASLQHRKQPEVKLSKGSSLYPNTLQPFDSPKDALEKCLIQIESPEWEIVMQSLQGIVRLTRHHPEYLVSALHRVVTGLSKQIRSLRSQVTKAACVVSLELFEHLGKTMDPEVEEIAPALLSRTFDANKFLQHDANSALDSMIDNVSATRSATFLLSKGAKHRNAVVRTTACRLLARLCQNLGVEHVYSLPRDTRDSILNAAAKFLLEGSLETRAHAKELFSVLAKEPKFMRIMNDVVPSKTMEAVRKPLIKIINQK